MADYQDVDLAGRFTFTLREAQWAKPNQRGSWRRANCKLCGARLPIDMDEPAGELLHRLYEHSCAARE